MIRSLLTLLIPLLLSLPTPLMAQTAKQWSDTTHVRRTTETVQSVLNDKQPLVIATVLFPHNSFHIKDGQQVQVENIVKFLQNHPKARIRLDGYSEESTGSPTYNLHLSIQRAIVLKKVLVEEYGVDVKRLEVQGIGTNAQPYKQKELNRSVVVTVIP